MLTLQVECISFNPIADQMNILVWSILKRRLQTRTVLTLKWFQKAFNDEFQIMEQNYLKIKLSENFQDLYLNQSVPWFLDLGFS